MQALGGENMPLDPIMQWAKGMDAGPDLIGQRRQREVDALAGVALRLPVQRLMLPELLEQDHRQKAGSKKASRCRIKRRGRLADGLAFAAGELLADRLDDLPLPRDHLKRLGDVFTQLR